MITFENVTKKYRSSDRPALQGVSLEIDKGDFVFLVGASGSGKSTLLRLILKEEKVSSGAVHVLGYNVRSISSRRVPFYRRNLGVVFQDFRLLPNKTAAENVAFALEVTGKSAGYIQEAVPDVLRLVGLDGKGDARPHELSGGEQQRVAIARAVVTKPAILLADEPTGNLDPDTSAGIMALLERINGSGTTILMATHDTTIVNRMRKRVIGLEQGRLIRDERDAVYSEVSSAADAAAARQAEGTESKPRATRRAAGRLRRGNAAREHEAVPPRVAPARLDASQASAPVAPPAVLPAPGPRTPVAPSAVASGFGSGSGSSAEVPVAPTGPSVSPAAIPPVTSSPAAAQSVAASDSSAAPSSAALPPSQAATTSPAALPSAASAGAASTPPAAIPSASASTPPAASASPASSSSSFVPPSSASPAAIPPVSGSSALRSPASVPPVASSSSSVPPSSASSASRSSSSVPPVSTSAVPVPAESILPVPLPPDPIPFGQAPLGSIPPVEIPSGQNALGKNASGQIPPVPVPVGETPNGEPDIQVIAHESQPLTERLGLVGGNRPPRVTPRQDDEKEQQ